MPPGTSCILFGKTCSRATVPASRSSAHRASPGKHGVRAVSCCAWTPRRRSYARRPAQGLLDRNHSRLGHAVDGGSAQRELRDGLRGLRHSTRDPENKGAKAQNPDYHPPRRSKSPRRGGGSQSGKDYRCSGIPPRREGREGAPHPVRRYIPELMVNRAVKWCPNTPRGYTMGW